MGNVRGEHATAPAVRRNNARWLSLMCRLRVNSGTACLGKLEEIAELGGVGLTPHAVAVNRAVAAVAKVNETFEKAANAGDLRELNRSFKEARAVDPSIRYVDYLEARKAAMLEALASGAKR
jgi:hypothetical protein